MSRGSARRTTALVPLIRRITRSICSRRRLSPDEAEDFESYLFEILFADRRRILEQFRGEGPLSAYLRVAIGRLLLDYRAREWGRWRPSSRARRLGSTAIALERLIERDGCTRWEAVRHLRVNRGAAESELDLLDLAGRLPHRPGRRFEGEGVLERLPAPDTRGERPDRCVEDEDALRVRRALRRVIAECGRRDRRLLTQRFVNGLTVAEIARRSGQSQRLLYRKLERTLARLRERMSSLGVDGETARSVFVDPA